MPNQKRGGRAKTIFDQAVEIASSEERAAYLDRACGGDPELRRKVDTLIRALAEAGDFLEARPVLGDATGSETGETEALKSGSASAPASGGAIATGVLTGRDAGNSEAHQASRTSNARPIVEGPGSMIGGYKLLERIGEGGMGAVYLAEQERPVRRRVALKVIKPGMDTEQVVARFQAERQALAIMDHASIAKVFDAGVTESGRPYFVMELVKGVPITEYCDAVHLTPKERLELFIPVCQAIQHAHQKGIIHRDIKPSNVLVAMQDGKPVPKVIDFGIAKAIDQRLTEKTFFTQHGAIIGTLEYMSPEQAEISAMDIDTRADIYALGVLLYELLTGSTPLERGRLREAGYSEILRRIREEDPPKPSTRLSESRDSLPSVAALRKTEPARLTRLVRGDLDWIVMKSLEKDRTRRYGSASDFARDIERHLEGDPVEAGPPGAMYRLRKLARKHRTGLITASLLLLSLIGGIVGTTLGLIEATRQKGDADAQRQKALDRLKEIQKVNGLLTQSVERETKANAELSTANSQVQSRFDLAMEAIKTFHAGVAEDVLLKNPNLTQVRNRLLKNAAEFYKRLAAQLSGKADPTSRHALGQGYREMARLATDLGATDQAVAGYRQALLVIREYAARANADNNAPAAADATLGIALTLTNLGNLLRETGRLDEARSSYEEARSLLEGLTRAHPDNTQSQSALAHCLNNIGNLLAAAGKPQEALELHQAARAIRQKLVDANPSDPTFQTELAMSLGNIGGWLSAAGKSREALESHEGARVIRQRLADANPADTENQVGLANAYHNKGGVLFQTGRPREAIESYYAGHAVIQKLADANPAVTRFKQQLANSHSRIGELLSAIGRPAEALSACNAAREVLQRLVAENPTFTDFQQGLGYCYSNIARLQRTTGRPDAALTTYHEALAIWQKLVDANPEVSGYQDSLASSHTLIGVVLRETGKPQEALVSIRAAHAITQRLVDANPSDMTFQAALADNDMLIGTMLVEIGKVDEALASHHTAGAILQKLAEANPAVISYRQHLANNYIETGILLKQLGRLEEALATCKTARGIQQAVFDANPTGLFEQSNLANYDLEIGDILRLSGQTAEAQKSFERALAVIQTLNKAQPNLASYLMVYEVFGLKGLGGTQLTAGHAADAVATWRTAITRAQGLRSPSNELLLALAGCHARLGAITGVAGSGISPAEGVSEVDRAMLMLRRAIAGGYRNVNGIKVDPDIATLGARSDFRLLMMDLEFPAEPIFKDAVTDDR